jgi:ankyrin repeat protein
MVFVSSHTKTLLPMSKVNGGEATYTKTRSFKSEVEFELLVKGAGANSFVGLMTDLNKWATEYKYTPDYFRGDVLDPFLCRQLLLAVCLSGGFDTTEKLNAIVTTYGADVNFDGYMDDSYEHPMLHPTYMGDTIAISAPPPKLRGLLALAVFHRETESIGALLSQGADPNARFHPWGENTFVRAATDNCIETVKILHRYGANLWQSDPMGHTAMECAVREGHVELVDYFLRDGFSPLWFHVDTNMSLLHYAVEGMTSRNTDVVQLLLTAGANPHVRCLHRGKHGMGAAGNGITPLQYLRDTKMGPTSWKNLTHMEARVVAANDALLSEKMQDNVEDVRLAVCMSAHNRLGSSSTSSLNCLAGEPALLQIIMDNMCNKYDPSYPLEAVVPSEE